MRNQSEFIYAFIIFALIVSLIFLTYININSSMYSSHLEYNFESLDTLSNYIKGFITLSLQLYGYQASQDAGLGGFGQSIWISGPYGCNLPPNCNKAINNLENLTESESIGDLTFSNSYLSNLRIYFPYNISIYTQNSNFQFPPFCNDLQNYYNGYYYNVSGLFYSVSSNQVAGYESYNKTIIISNDTALYLYGVASQWASTQQASLDVIHACIQFLIQHNLLPKNACYPVGGTDPAQALQQYFDNPYVSCSDSESYIGLIGHCPVCQSQNQFCSVSILCKDSQENIIYNGHQSPQEIQIEGMVYAVNVSLCSYNFTVYNCNIIKEVNTTNNEVISFNYNCKISQTSTNCVFPSNPECRIFEYCDILSHSSSQSGDIVTYYYNVNIYEQNITTKDEIYIGLPCSVYLPCCPLPPKDNYPTMGEIQSLCGIDP